MTCSLIVVALSACGSSSASDEPPAATVSSPSGEIEAEQGSYCWEDRCADFAAPDGDEPVLHAARGDALDVRFGGSDEPRELSVSVLPGRRQVGRRQLGSRGDGAFDVPLPLGTYWATVSGTWRQGPGREGGASYHFRLEVTAPGRRGRVMAGASSTLRSCNPVARGRPCSHPADTATTTP